MKKRRSHRQKQKLFLLLQPDFSNFGVSFLLFRSTLCTKGKASQACVVIETEVVGATLIVLQLMIREIVKGK